MSFIKTRQAKPDHGQGRLYLSGGRSSWPVTYRIRTEEIGQGRTTVTGTITFVSRPGAASRGATLDEVRAHMRDPNKFFLLPLSEDRWVYLLIKSTTEYDVGEIMDGYIVDPPPWAERKP
ncbi:MAG: hypothetical protein IH957_10010 [Chloroflexi bacterium]|nr:hypothetical protein [Chloroflexota bacterium]